MDPVTKALVQTVNSIVNEDNVYKFLTPKLFPREGPEDPDNPDWNEWEIEEYDHRLIGPDYKPRHTWRRKRKPGEKPIDWSINPRPNPVPSPGTGMNQPGSGGGSGGKKPAPTPGKTPFDERSGQGGVDAANDPARGGQSGRFGGDGGGMTPAPAKNLFGGIGRGEISPRNPKKRGVTRSGEIIEIDDPGYHPLPGKENIIDGSGRRNVWRDRSGNIRVTYGIGSEPGPGWSMSQGDHVELGDDYKEGDNLIDYYKNKIKQRVKINEASDERYLPPLYRERWNPKPPVTPNDERSGQGGVDAANDPARGGQSGRFGGDGGGMRGDRRPLIPPPIVPYDPDNIKPLPRPKPWSPHEGGLKDDLPGGSKERLLRLFFRTPNDERDPYPHYYTK